MDFSIFQNNCKYAKYGLRKDTVREFELTCRNPECIPEGCSWGVCDEKHCPHFGVICIEVSGGEMINQETGKVLLTFGKGKVFW